MTTPGRLRYHPSWRALTSEISLSPSDFIAPVFIDETRDNVGFIEGIPNVPVFPPGETDREIQDLWDLGIRSVLLFGIPAAKDAMGSGAWNPNGGVQQTITRIKSNWPDMLVMADCCCCEYTDHGACGIVENGTIAHDATGRHLGKIAQSYATAGVDIVAPSGMIINRVSAIRSHLDSAGFSSVGIVSYSAKFASHFYGPFRQLAKTQPMDRQAHQLGIGQRSDALQEVAHDIAAGADGIIVKPTALDIIRDVRSMTPLPVFGYHVSGEYAMIMAGHAAGILDAQAAFHEVFMGMKRAGATGIISYYTKQYWKVTQ